MQAGESMCICRNVSYCRYCTSRCVCRDMCVSFYRLCIGVWVCMYGVHLCVQDYVICAHAHVCRCMCAYPCGVVS